MKRCIYSLVTLLLSLSALYVPAGDLEFYSDYNTLLKMEKKRTADIETSGYAG